MERESLLKRIKLVMFFYFETALISRINTGKTKNYELSD